MSLRRPNVEVRFSQLDHLPEAERASLEVHAVQQNETRTQRADREPSREELQVIQELVDAANSFWSRLGVQEPVADVAQFVPVREETLRQVSITAAPEVVGVPYPAIVQNNHVYYPAFAQPVDRLRVLSHELSHLASREVIQVEPAHADEDETPLTTTTQLRQRREGARFAAPAWEREFGIRGFTMYHESIMELLASDVRHVWCDSQGIAKGVPERAAITTPTSYGPAPRILEDLMDAFVREHPGISRRQLKNEAYLDIHNGTFEFLRRIHEWRPKFIKPLARMGTTYADMRDAARALELSALADAIEAKRIQFKVA